MAIYKITGISKEGSVISITVETKDKPITIDCTSRKITSYTGREVKYFPATASANGLSTGERWAINTIKDWLKFQNVRQFATLELFIANLDLISNVFSIPSECPKGYIKWLRDNGKMISDSTLTEFRHSLAENSLTKEDKEILEKMREVYREGSNILGWYISNEDKELRKKFNQILKTSAKGFDWCLADSLSAWFTSFIRQELGKRVFGDNWVEHLDGNRDFRYNIKVFEYARDKERNDKILANEAKIKDIEQLSDEHFTIIVPSDIEEFTNEGKMQNNCVGSYYHDSMARGSDLIYFIRLTSKPNRSYITNRYNVGYKETVESRMVNNDDNTDVLAKLLISNIDKKIRELLSAEQ